VGFPFTNFEDELDMILGLPVHRRHPRRP
jgi:hypothetical protein